MWLGCTLAIGMGLMALPQFQSISWAMVTPVVWTVSVLAFTHVFARWLRRGGRPGRASALRWIGFAVAVLTGLAWAGFVLLVHELRGIGPL